MFRSLEDGLRESLYEGRYEELHGPLCKLFHDDIFRRSDGLTTAQQCQITYDRLRFLNTHTGPGRALVQDPARLLAVTEWSGIADGSLLALASIHYNLCIGTMLDAGGGRAEIDGYLTELDDMSSTGVFLATELGYGNNVASLETKAVYDRDTEEFVIHTPSPQARKFMPNTAHPGVPKIAVVMAQLIVDGLNHGVFPFIVRVRDVDGPCPGITIFPLPEKSGWSLDNAITSFDQVRVPRANLLAGPHGEFTAGGTFTSTLALRRGRFLNSMRRVGFGKLMLSAANVAMARASTYIALRYAHQRMTFGASGETVPVIAYRTHKASLFGALALTYAMTFLVNHAKHAWLGRADDLDPEIERILTATKALCTWGAADVFRECRERCGAQGLFAANRVADYIITNQGAVTAEGDNQVILLKAAQEMTRGRSYEPPPISSLPPQGRQLDDLDWLLSLFEQREALLHGELNRRTRHQRDKSRTRFEVANDSANLALRLGRAYGGRLALREFCAAIERTSDPAAQHALALLARLYAVQELGRDSGWFLAEGLITADHVRQIPDFVDSLCADVTPHSAAMVEAFGIPNSMLQAPIAASDYVAHYEDILSQYGSVPHVR
ncbi:acyl-CoA dehydrogenase [Micromonospora sp. NPDC023814]|uniref:acyl-CoA dehydrogenase family protein n=1 Tax=Micromonospora sp. NPDC023814 TaxID=3154596 RepID=UPI0033F2DF93